MELIIPRRSVLAATALVLTGAFSSVHSTAWAAPTWARDEKDPRWVQGHVTAASTPDAVWARLARVPEWPRVFTDIKSLRVVERVDDYWRVRGESRTFDYGAYEYHARFDPTARTARGWFTGSGVSAVCTMRVVAGREADTAVILCSLFIDARGIAAWVIGRDELRRKQEHMVVQYLDDFDRWFRPRSTTTSMGRRAREA